MGPRLSLTASSPKLKLELKERRLKIVGRDLALVVKSNSEAV